MYLEEIERKAKELADESAASLYRESDFPRICAAIIDMLRVAAGEVETV